jgi:hypothetical protein
MLKEFAVVTAILFCSGTAYAIDFDIKSVRVTLSKPDTSNSLLYRSPQNATQKAVFNLRPVNNERLGVFVDINDIEIGYALDVAKSNPETKTQNIIVSYRKFKYSKITLNYQTLKGLQTSAENLSGLGVDNRFRNLSQSTKVELFGQHALHTFGSAESLFEHFFLNKPLLSNSIDWSVGIIGGWSFKHVSLENPQSIVFNPSFLSEALPAVAKLKSNSIAGNLGPFLSVNLPHNFHFFAEYKVGKGHIRSSGGNNNLKESGDEKQSAVGAGISWTSSDKKYLVLLRGWEQNGRHISTSFADFSVVRFF